MNFNLIQWLFTDPCAAGGGPATGNSTCPNPEVFHFYLPWIIFCAGVLVAWFYYSVEGRKRLFAGDALWRSILDRVLNQLALIAFIGFFVMFFRNAADSSLFAWRFWRYGWLLWLAIVAGRWALYFMFKYKDERLGYNAYRTHQKYVPQPKNKRTARAGTR